MASTSVVSQAFRFARGLRSFLHTPLTLPAARAAIEEGLAHRDELLLGLLDDSVWDIPTSPYLALLRNAGLERGDVRELVGADGVDGALEQLRDAGVYVAYEEYLGIEPAVRGSQTFSFGPPQFANPHIAPDYMQTSGGTRSAGTASGSSFQDRVRKAADLLIIYDGYGVVGAPGAVWMPALPSSAGIGGVLNRAGIGTPAERWFSPIDPYARGIPLRKQSVSWLLPVVARAYGGRVPRPRYVPTSEPGQVLEWCQGALARDGRAVLHCYPSSAVALAQAAIEGRVALDGLVLRCGGEPVTPARRKAIEASGATACQLYAFSPAGTVASACPRCEGDEMHLHDHAFGSITRRRPRADGVMVDAFLWTSLAPTSGQVLLNMENDDYGMLLGPAEICGGPLDALGLRRKISGVRGISKVVAGGVTVDGELLVQLVDAVLPARFGGAPSDYQFAEAGADGVARLELRVSARLPGVVEEEVVEVVEAALRGDELGLLAASVWSPSQSVRVVREQPRVARSGKTLAFEPLYP